MGYQAYAHKLITGRRERIHTLKQFGGLSGFNNKDESPYDLFTTGHGGTCLSSAMGLALAREQAQEKRQVVAIIGDASLGEGMALEALNHIGHVKPNLLVILNDNKMSIAPPVGALSRYLNRIITNPLYNRIRRELEDVVIKLPKGRRLVHLGHKVEESLKGLLTPGLWFEELGFRYVGPVDGHDLRELITTLRNLKRLKGPILLHVLTLKGKGYRPAEQDPERFHKVEPFDVRTGHSKAAGSRFKVQGSKQSPATFTEAFGEELVRLAETNERIIAITAAMPEGTGVATFGNRFPQRYFDVGMAEQHGLGLAAGLARAGQRPVVAMYSTFLQRAFDQIMHELCLQNLPVVLAIDRGGLVGEDGPTHHGAFDLTYLRPLPNLVVMSPKDPDELRAMLRWALARPGSEIDPASQAPALAGGAGRRDVAPEGRTCGTPGLPGGLHGRAGEARGPVAIRYPRGGIAGELVGKCARIVLGKAELLRPGDDLAILALGSLVYPALEVAARLRRDGIEAAVVNARFAKPLDRALLRQLATQTGALVTLEEGQVAGGFGSAVSEALEAMGLHAVPLHRIGLPDRFLEHGKRAELLTLYQLDADGLTQRIATWFNALKASADEIRLLA